MKEVSLLILIVYASLSCKSQEAFGGTTHQSFVSKKDTVTIHGLLKNDKGDTLSNYQIVVINGSDTICHNIKKEYKIELPIENEYVFEFIKNGYLRRHLGIHLLDIPSEDSRYGFNFPMTLKLVKGDDNLSSDKMVTIFFDKNIGYLDFTTTFMNFSKNSLLFNNESSQVRIGVSTRKEVKRIIGKGKKGRDTTCFRNDCGSVVIYIYQDIGLEFFYNEKANASKDTLTEVTIRKSCVYRSVDGIGIGSKRKEVELSLGKPKKVNFYKLVNGFKHEIIYDGIIFIFEKGKLDKNSETDDIVTEISFW